MLPLSNMSASSMTFLSTLQHHDTKLARNRLRESYRAQMPKQRWVKQSVQEIVGRLAIKPPLRLAASHKTPRPFPEARREANLQTRQSTIRIPKYNCTKFELIFKQVELHCEVDSLICKSTQKRAKASSGNFRGLG
jgi:tRNA U55 pseudouridine synthase TruB